MFLLIGTILISVEENHTNSDLSESISDKTSIHVSNDGESNELLSFSAPESIGGGFPSRENFTIVDPIFPSIFN
jgi:hypothetical protein